MGGRGVEGVLEEEGGWKGCWRRERGVPLSLPRARLTAPEQPTCKMMYVAAKPRQDRKDAVRGRQGNIPEHAICTLNSYL
jgi:hypothetical protein